MNSAIESEIVAPYAQALMSVAQSNNLVDRIADDIRSILTLIDESSELSEFLASPLAKIDAKKGVLRQILGDSVHAYTSNFVMVLVDKGRIPFLAGVGKQYLVLVRELKQIVLAEVTSATPLSEQQQETIRQKVVAMTGASSVELETAIDADLIGGVVIKVGSKVVDASLRGQLRRIGLKLSSAS
ncbi:MAG: ATP synthase F1 subunit delta [Cyanobacteria bacterium P01_F01_bin.150]